MLASICIVLLLSGCLIEVASQPPQIIDFPKNDLNNPNDVKAKTDNGFTIVCKASGSAPFTFSWKRSGTPMIHVPGKYEISTSGNMGKLQVKIPMPTDNGKYQCFVTNSKGATFSRKLRVRVTYAAVFKNRNENFVEDKPVVIGQPTLLRCPEHEGGTEFGASHFWGRANVATNDIEIITQSANVAMTQIGDLFFLFITKKDLQQIQGFPGGTIQCTVQAGDFNYRSHQFRLRNTSENNSPFPPQFEGDGEPLSTEQAVQSKAKALFCIARASPAPTIVWKRLKDNKEIEIQNEKGGYKITKFGRILEIPVANKQQHEAVYWCVVTNSIKSVTSRRSQLVVNVPPVWSEKPSSKVVIPMHGGRTLKCKADGTPTPIYTWYANGTVITADTNHIIRKGNELELKNVQLYQHGGSYQCVAENSYGMIVSSIWIKIDVKAPNIKNFGPFYLFKETTGKLDCDSNAAPAAEHTWFKDGKELLMTGRYSLGPGNSLIIKGVVDGDAGGYRCFAKNIEGEDTATESATVYDRTKITVKPQANVNLTLGKPQDLRCEATADRRLLSILKYKWLKDGAPLKYSENVKWIPNQLVLKLYKATINDGAKYTCVAYTDDPQKRSEDSASSIANVKGVPYPPSSLSITNCDEGSTVITWKSGSSIGDPITHYIIEQESEFNPDVWETLKRVDDINLRTVNLTLTFWANLTFRMRAVNKVGPSRPSMPTAKGMCNTKMSRPTMFPENLRGVPKEAYQLDIAWKPMTKLQQNGPEFEYILQFRKVNKDGSTTDWKTVTIGNPKQDRYSIPDPGYYEKWQFTINAKNKLGPGPVSDIEWSYSGQNAPTGKPENVVKGTITSRTVELTWDRVTVTRGSVDGYHVYHWGKSLIQVQASRRRREIPGGAKYHKANSTTHLRQTTVVRDLIPYTAYTVAIKAFNSGGEGPSSAETVFETLEDVPGEVADFDVTPFAKYIFAAWGAPLYRNGILLGYAIAAVKHTKGQPDPAPGSVAFKTFEANTQEHLFTEILPESHYIVYVKAMTKIGYGPVLKARVDTIAPAVPAKPRAPLVIGHSTTAVNVTFLFGKTRGGYPTQFKVKYRNKAGNDASYKETSWENHLIKRWIIVDNLSADLHEFLTVGKNDIGESVDSPPTDGRPLPYVGVGKREATPIYRATWFIILLVLIALLLLFIVIVLLYRKRSGAKYPVGQREKKRAGMLDQYPPDEEEGVELSRPEDNPPPYPSQGSIDKPSFSDDDRDSLDDYGEGPQFKEDGSFIEEYGDDKKKLTDAKDSNATATFV